jgi:hypothetical protein
MNFLNVPYAEKDEARALGARWNPTRKKWYVPDGVALAPFERWLAGAPADAGGARPGRVDTAAAKLAVGANYVELAHACNPFEPCAECGAKLAGGPWNSAQAALVRTIAALKPR